MMGPRIGPRIGPRVGAAVGIGADEIAGAGAPAWSPLSIQHVAFIGDSTTLGQGDYQTADYGLNAGAVFAAASIHTANSFLGTGFGRQAVQPYDVGGGPNMGSELSLARMLIANGVAPGLPMSKMGINGSTLALWLNPTNLAHAGDYFEAQELATNVPITHILDGRGPNDAATDADAAAADANYEALYTYFTGRFGNRFEWILALLHPSTTSASITTARKNTFRAGQISFAARHSNVRTIEIGHALLGADSIHPHADGHWSIGNSFGRALIQIPVRGTGASPRLVPVLEPTRRSDSAGVDVTPTAGPTWAGQLQLLLTSTAGLDVAPSLATANGFAEVTNLVSLGAGVRQWGAAYLRLVTEADLAAAGGVRLPDPVVDGATLGVNQQRRSAVILTLDNVATDGTALNAIASRASAAYTTAVSVTGPTTTAPNCLVVVANTGHSGTDSVASGFANAGLSGFTFNQDCHGPTQQKFSISSGIKVGPGLVPPTTGTQSVNLNQAGIALAFRAP